MLIAFALSLQSQLNSGPFVSLLPEEQKALGCAGCSDNFIKMILKLVFVSMGDTNNQELLENTLHPTFSLIIYLVYLVLVYILLLNLIIAMMGQTYHPCALYPHLLPFMCALVRA